MFDIIIWNHFTYISMEQLIAHNMSYHDVCSLTQEGRSGSRTEFTIYNCGYARDNRGNLYEISLHVVPKGFPEIGNTITVHKVGDIGDKRPGYSRKFTTIPIPDVFSFEEINSILDAIRWSTGVRFSEKRLRALIRAKISGDEKVLRTKWNPEEAFTDLKALVK